MTHLRQGSGGHGAPDDDCDLWDQRGDWCPPARAAVSATRKCRVCGCTDTQACMTEEGPCFWLEEDLCSAHIDEEDGE